MNAGEPAGVGDLCRDRHHPAFQATSLLTEIPVVLLFGLRGLYGDALSHTRYALKPRIRKLGKTIESSVIVQFVQFPSRSWDLNYV